MEQEENYYERLRDDMINYFIINPDDVENSRGIERIQAFMRDETVGASITVSIEHDTNKKKTMVSSVEIWDDGIETVNEINSLEKLDALIDRILSIVEEEKEDIEKQEETEPDDQ